MLEEMFCFWRYGVAQAGLFSSLFLLLILMHYRVLESVFMALLWFLATFIAANGLLFCVSQDNPMSQYHGVLSSSQPLEFLPYITMLYLSLSGAIYGAVLFIALRPGRKEAGQERDKWRIQ